MAEFEPAWEFLLPHEGGFQKIADDPGNWTGGEVGAGELKGTKFGISAARYPGLDIEGLTIQEAHDIYLRDWWDKEAYLLIDSQDVANKVFDLSVNMGVIPAFKVLQRAILDCGWSIPVDGKLGPLTLNTINQTNDQNLLTKIRCRATDYYQDILKRDPAMQRFAQGWFTRAKA